MAPKDDKVDWYPFEDGRDDTGELTQDLLTSIEQKLANNPDMELAGVLWVQGESDTGYADQYQANLTELHRLLTESFGDDFVFTVSQLSENMDWFQGYSGQLAIQEAQEAFVDATDGTTLLDPDDAIAAYGLSPEEAVADAIHFNDDGADAISQAFFDQFYDLM